MCWRKYESHETFNPGKSFLMTLIRRCICSPWLAFRRCWRSSGVSVPLQLPFNLPAEHVRVPASRPSVTEKVFENKVNFVKQETEKMSAINDLSLQEISVSEYSICSRCRCILRSFPSLALLAAPSSPVASSSSLSSVKFPSQGVHRSSARY